MSLSSSSHPAVNLQFAQDVLEGLGKRPRKLSSKYFYDARGDRLFQQIMNMPEYYLTDSELDIFRTQKEEILKAINGPAFELIELGAGDGTKTKILLEHFLQQEVDFEYRPIDISRNVLDLLEKELRKSMPGLRVKGLKGDYFKVLHQLSEQDHLRKVVLFLGANIGNYTQIQAQRFLKMLSRALHPEDMLLIGFDLKKDPEIILRAYNDPGGITAAFNLNLLRRINRELGGNFELEAFKHWETYHPITGEARSFLVSTKKQAVRIKAIDKNFHFDAWEAIEVELSLKYSLPEIEFLAETAGFRIVRHFFDKKEYFVDTLMGVKR